MTRKDLWSPQKIEALNEGLKLRLSATKIAAHINSKLNLQWDEQVSRNAVIGKMKRMGLESAEPRGGNHGLRIKRPKGPHTSVKRVTMPQTAKPLPKEVAAPDPSANVTLMGLLDGLCKWPVGELYCGMVTESARTTYCDFHRKVNARQSSGNPHPTSATFRSYGSRR